MKKSDYTVIQIRHMKEVFIKSGDDYRHLKFSKNTCLHDRLVSRCFYLDRINYLKTLQNVKTNTPNLIELQV